MRESLCVLQFALIPGRISDFIRIASYCVVMAPSEQEIIAATNEILKNCDITLLTAKSIRLQLESIFECDLTESKGLIRTCLENFMDKNEDAVLYANKIKAESNAEQESSKSSKKRGMNVTVWFMLVLSCTQVDLLLMFNCRLSLPISWENFSCQELKSPNVFGRTSSFISCKIQRISGRFYVMIRYRKY